MRNFKLQCFINKLVLLVVVLISRTLRIKVIGKIPEHRAIYTFWHGNFFPLIFPFRRMDMALLVSTHRDGEYLAQGAKALGYKVIRGSSDNRGMAGMLDLLRLSTSSIAFATDGPRGPRNVVKIGILKISELSGMPLVPVGIGISRYFELKSWDRFKLPHLFARCVIKVGKEFYIKSADETARQEFEKELIRLNDEAGRMVGKE